MATRARVAAGSTGEALAVPAQGSHRPVPGSGEGGRRRRVQSAELGPRTRRSMDRWLRCAGRLVGERQRRLNPEQRRMQAGIIRA